MDDVEQQQEEPTFPGFEYPTKQNGFTQIANANFALCAKIDNLAELKIVLYLMRHTWGFHEYEPLKWITTDEFVNGRKRKDETRMDEGSGLKTTAAKEGVARAIEHGYIICEVDASDKGRIRKSYRLKMVEGVFIDELDSRNATIGGHIATTDSREATMHGRDTTSNRSHGDHRTEKETLETNLEKQTKERGGTRDDASGISQSLEGSKTSFEDAYEQHVWTVERAAKIVKRMEPSEKERKQIAELTSGLRLRELPIEQFKVDLIRRSWQWSVEVHHYKDTRCMLGNTVTSVLEYIDEMMPNQPADEPEVAYTEQELIRVVWWTRVPDTAFYGRLEDNLHLLERMTVREAKQYRYGEFTPFTDEEEAKITRWKQEAAMLMREAVEA